MMDFLEERRRIEIRIREKHGEESIWLFDAGGRLLSEPAAGDKKLQECLSALCLEQPRVSGLDEMVISPEENEDERRIHLRRYIDLTLGELAAIQAKRFPGREAVVDVRQNVRLTYAMLEEKSRSFAKSLLRIGIKKGEHIAVIMDNSWENMVTKLAIEKLGAVIVNLNIHEKAGMLQELLFRSDVAAIILKQGIKSGEHMKMLYEICPELTRCKPGDLACESLPKLRHLIVTDPAKSQPCAWQFEDLLKEGAMLPDEDLQRRQESISPLEPVTIIHTSGTSGVPKGVVMAHYQLIENARSHVEYMELTENDRFCSTSPMFHSLGCVGSALTSMLAGAALICYDRPRCENLLDIVAKEGCTVLCSVPTVFIQLVSLMKERQIKASGFSLRLCITAGAPCPRQTLVDMKQVLGAEAVITMYGMTEAGPGITSTSLKDPLDVVVQTSGRLWPGVTAQIRDLETGKVLETGQVGEICIKSYGVMQGYYRLPEETAKAIDSSGWLHTGDLGSFSEDGLLTLKGRCKDLIIRGGENISPREVEDFLRLNESIDDAAVVGIPDEKYGEMVVAFLKLKPGDFLDQETLAKWCKGKIATIKIPQRITLVDSFPVSATGKVAKGKLRKMAMDGC